MATGRIGTTNSKGQKVTDPRKKKKTTTKSTSTSTSKSTKRIPITLGNGSKVYYDSSGTAWSSSSGGSKVSNKSIEASKAGTKQRVPAGDPELDSIVNNKNLTGDQKNLLKTLAGADEEKAARLMSAMKAATEYSDPYFKAQIRLATDALERGIKGKEDDLSFQEEQQRRTLEELRQNTAASKDYLSVQHQQELAQLARKYEQDLQTTQENLAATGFTSSSRRVRAEQLISEENKGLVESSNKQYGYQTGNLDRALNFKSADTAAQIENYRRLTSEGKLDLLRAGEEKLGAGVLSDLGYNALNPSMEYGSLQNEQRQSNENWASKLASNFIF